MRDYYAQHHGLCLARPLVMGSLPGGRGDEVCHALASLTGLPVTRVDVHVMHQTGRALSLDVLGQGLAHVRAVKAKVVRALLRQSPPMIVALGDVSLVDTALWNEIQTRADTVGIQWTPLEMLSLLGKVGEMKRRQFWQLHDESFDGYADVDRVFAQENQRLKTSNHVVLGRGRSALGIARHLIERLNIDVSGDPKSPIETGLEP